MKPNSNKNNSTSNGAVPKRRVLGVKPAVPSAKAPAADGSPPASKQFLQALDSTNELSYSDSSSVSLSSLDQPSAESLQESLHLFCPICNEKMLTLNQLNRHLDDEHKSNEPVKQLDDDIKTWFKKKVISKANDVIGDRKNFVKLDLFDNDKNFSFTTANESSTAVNDSATKVQIEIPKTHWKKPVGNDICHMGGCTKYLNIKNGNVNCRKCGYLFCNEHTFYKIKINEELEYDAENGVLVRCCQDCFFRKPGYNDTAYTRDLTDGFKAKRTARNDERELEVNRLERRLIKFYDYFLAAELNQRLQNFKKFETSVVNWENDAEHQNCFICDFKFSITTMLRKHHCRLCGKVVCGDLERQCSMEVPIGVLMQYLTINSQESSKLIPLKKNADKTIRCCHVCKKTLFDKKLFVKDLLAPKPEILRIYDTILIYRNRIESLLPEFKDSMMILQDLDNGKADTHNRTMNKLLNNHEQIQSISRDRVKLKDLFKKLDSLTKKLHHKLNNDEKEALISFDELRLEKSIYTVSVIFLQENMSKLQEVSLSEQAESKPPTPTKPKITKKEIRMNREKLMVLKEQKFLVEEMIITSKRKRKFDDLKSLEMNLKDLEKEISEIDDALGDEFGFE